MSENDERHGIQEGGDDGRIQNPPPVARGHELDADDDFADEPIERPPENRALAVWSHWGGFLAWIIIPLVFYMQENDKRSLVASHAREAINFQIMIMIYYLIAAFLPSPLFCLVMVDPLFVLLWAVVTILFVVLMAVYELAVVIMAGLAASRGQRYRYPLTIPFIATPSDEPNPYDDRP